MTVDMSQYKVQTNTVKFKQIGDKVQGTLIAIRIVSNRLNEGKDQNVYDLKLEGGSVVSVFGKPGLDFQMRLIKLGQIVEIIFEKQIPSKTFGFSPTNVLQVYADPKIVDQEWLNQQEEEAAAEAAGKAFNQTGPSFMDTPQPPPRGATEVKPFSPSSTVQSAVGASPSVSGGVLAGPAPKAADVPFESAPPSKEAMIKDWAKAKIPGTDDTNYANNVMQATGIPFIPMNHDKILAALQALA